MISLMLLLARSKSLMYIKNNNGPGIKPRETPMVIISKGD